MFAFIQSFIDGLINLTVALSLVLIGFVVGKLAELCLNFSIKGIEIDVLFKKLGLRILLQKTLPKVVYFCVVMFFFILALNMLGLTKLVVLFVSAVFILLVLFYSLSYMNYFSSNLSFSPKVKIGNELKLDNIKGRILNVCLTEVIIESGKNKFVIPNSLIYKNS